jgi:hypothetical protein
VSNDVSTGLLLLGIAFCIGIPLMIIISFLNGKHHLVTCRNTILAGCVPFVGLSSIGLATWERPYGLYTWEDFQYFALMIVGFVIVFCVAYNVLSPGQAVLNSFSGRNINVNSRLTFAITIIAIGFSSLDFIMKRLDYMPFVTELLSALAPSFMAFASLFSIAGWRRNKNNPLAFGLFLAVISFSLVYSILGSGGGRRVLLSVLTSIPVYFYWSMVTNRVVFNRGALLFKSLIVSIPLVLIILGYSNLRHHNSRSEQFEAADVNRSIESFTKIPSEILAIVRGERPGSIFLQIGQDAANASMLMGQAAREGADENFSKSFAIPQPFHSMIFVVANPIPRSVWPDKPLSLGYMLPREILNLRGITIGAGIVGHCIHEGGMLFIVFYGFLFAYMAKVVDVSLIRDSSNLFLLGFATAAFPNILMLVRGDQGLVIVIVIFSYIVFSLCWRIAAAINREPIGNRR